MIKVQEVTKKYSDFKALDSASFELREGEIVGLLGPNGAGKTTLLRILVGYIKPTSGEIEIEGMNPQKPNNTNIIKSKIGYLPEQAPLYDDMLVSEYLEFIGKMQGVSEDKIDSAVENVVKKCGLGDKKNAEIVTLSKGYRQRVGIAQALIHNPKIVILDEPTTGLDPNQRIEIRDLIKEIGREHMVILSSHILSEVQSTCSRVLIINKGRIVADGNPEELEKEGRGEVVVKIEVEKNGSPLLEKINNIKGVVSSESEGNMILIVTDKEIDIRAKIAEVVALGGFGLLSLEKKQTSLEDIFINLTNKENE